jgi:dihydropteroate synthase
MASLALYHALGVPLLLGASRKKLIDHISDVPDPEDRVSGSIAAALAGAAQGVQIVRVHDVAATRQALSVWQAVTAGSDKVLG